MKTVKWDLESEYKSIDSIEFKNDVEFVKKSLAELNIILNKIDNDVEKVENLEKFQPKYINTLLINYNLSNYIQMSLSTDSTNEVLSKAESNLSLLKTELHQIGTKAELALIKLTDEDFKKLSKYKSLSSFQFSFEQSRSRKKYFLSDAEEVLVTSLSPCGPEAWAKLYSQLSGSIRCHVTHENKTEIMGLAKAQGLLFSSDESKRKSAWLAIQEAWKAQQITASSILNNLAGWRLELTKKRSHSTPQHFLDNSLFENKLSKKTLDAMMLSIRNHKSRLQKAGLLMAETLGKKQLDPWDTLAPYPKKFTGSAYTFEQAIEIIKNAVASVSSEMSEFVQLVADKKWVDGQVLPNKRTGAYCSGFPKSKTPRIFMTFMGSNHDIRTLAHELGHAYHNWLMRDLDFIEWFYPSTLAETASIFFETLLRDVQIKTAPTHEEKLSYLWGEIEASLGTILNISTRFEFELNFYEERKNGELSAQELCDLMDKAWKTWFGDTLRETDKYFWAHKLHFSLNKEFYNYPYTFGYLFALSIYARRETLGDSFLDAYKNILMDTGRMTAEDLIKKHLNEDITQVEFWDKALQIVLNKIDQYEKLKSETLT